MNCPKCGNEIAEEAKFCCICGAEIKKNKSHKKRNILLASLAFLVVVVIIYVSFSFVSQVKESVIGRYSCYDATISSKRENNNEGTLKKRIIYDRDNITLRVWGFERDDSYIYMNYELINNSENEFDMALIIKKINNISFSSPLSIHSEAGSTVADKLELIPIRNILCLDTIGTINLDIVILDHDYLINLFEDTSCSYDYAYDFVKNVTLSTDAGEVTQNISINNPNVVYEKNGFKVTAFYLSLFYSDVSLEELKDSGTYTEEEIDGLSKSWRLLFLVENNSGRDISITTKNIIVNDWWEGSDGEDSISTVIMNDTIGLTSANMLYLEDTFVEIEDAKEIKFYLTLTDAKSGKILDVVPVSIDDLNE